MNSRHCRNSKQKISKEFTLLEILLYIGISSIILLVSSLFLQTLLESRIKNQTIAEVEQQGLEVMQLITQTVRNADSINSPATGVSAPSLSINTYSAGLNPTVFDLSGGVIRITEGPSAPVSLTNSRINITSLAFSNLSRSGTPGTIRIQFTISHLNSIGRNEYNFSKTFTGTASLRQP